MPTIFLSHTTRDTRDVALAHRLAVGLRARGAGVWIAPDSIPSGDQWEEQVIAGILETCSHFLVILSAASVRASAVIEEIDLARQRYARERDFRILPLVMGDLETYPNRDFIDTFQRIPVADDFATVLDAVAISAGLGLPVPGGVGTLLDERTRDFVGRGYIFAEIETFLTNNLAGYFTVEGEPGIGKSAILAQFVKQTGSVAHFNVRGQGITTASQFLEDICAQLITRFGLPYASLPPAATRDGAFLARLLEEAAARLDDDSRLTIVVDALDEVDGSDREANVLFLPLDLPDRVYFILSRRPTSLAFSVRSPHRVLKLGQEYAEEGIQDVAEFVLRRATATSGLQSWLAEHKLTPQRFSSELAQKSRGNFMYVHYILPDIEKGRYEDLTLSELPVGLEEYYNDHWRRMGMRESPLPRMKIRVVYVLSVVTHPVSRNLIVSFGSDAKTSLDELTVQEVLDDWEQFLHQVRDNGVTRYSIYHSSFRDFLQDKELVQASGENLGSLHRSIADDLWHDLFEAE